MSIDTKGIKGVKWWSRFVDGNGWWWYSEFVNLMGSIHVSELTNIEAPTTIAQAWSKLCFLASGSNGELLGARVVVCELRAHQQAQCADCTPEHALAAVWDSPPPGSEHVCIDIRSHVALYLGRTPTLASLKELFDAQTVIYHLQEQETFDMLFSRLGRTMTENFSNDIQATINRSSIAARLFVRSKT